jgi:hypothetical protein
MLQYLDNLKHHFNLSFMLYIPCGDWHVSVGRYGSSVSSASNEQGGLSLRLC